MYRKNLTWLLPLFWALVACAVQAPPSGGPVDRIPPKIVRTNPMPGALSIPINLDRLTVVFSERMKEGSERNHIFLSPPVPFEVKWEKGRILSVRLKEALKEDQTYVLSIGSALQDAHNNKMTRSFTLAFSTGDSIDHGVISGRIYGLKRGESFQVFAYRLEDSLTFDPFSQKPNYVTMSGEQGIYALGYLKNGTYRVLAVEDRNHNLVLDAIAERFALPYRDVMLNDSLHTFVGLDMQLARLDTIPPVLTGARAKFRNLLILRFSEPLVWDRLTQITLADSLSDRPLMIKAWGRSPEKPNWLELVTAPMDSNRLYVVRCVNLVDSSGNRNPDTLVTFFRGTAHTDTSAFKLLKHTPKDSAKEVSPLTAVCLQFNQPVDWQKVEKHFVLEDDAGQAVPGTWRRTNLYRACFLPSKPLSPGKGYRSILRLTGIPSYFGRLAADSVTSHFFSVIASRELGEISGVVKTERREEHPIVLNLRRIGGKRFRRKMILRGRMAFTFAFIPEGSYKLDGFVDLNANGKLDHGTVFPFTFCEPFAFLPDTIKVRKRWETAGITITLPQAVQQ